MYHNHIMIEAYDKKATVRVLSFIRNQRSHPKQLKLFNITYQNIGVPKNGLQMPNNQI